MSLKSVSVCQDLWDSKDSQILVVFIVYDGDVKQEKVQVTI